MKKQIRVGLILILVTALTILLLSSCDVTPTESPEEPHEEKRDEPETQEPAHDPELLYLGENGSFRYRFVFAGETSAAVALKVRSIARGMTAKGFAAEEGIAEADSTSELEIVIGTESIRNGCCIPAHSLGLEGWLVKCVGDRVVIAGGSEDATVKALQAFYDAFSVAEGVATVRRDFTASFVPVYTLTDVTFGGLSIAEYTIVADRADRIPYAAAYDFRACLYEETGIWIPIAATSDGVSHPFYFRTVANAGDTGFRVLIHDGKAAIESKYANVYDRFYRTFAEELFGKTGVAEYEEGYLHTERANILRYSDFGAVGDGVTDDFNAIYATHESANLYGQKVLADAGKTYYIGQTTKAIPILTDTDWTGATFIIDDTVVDLNHRERNIFQVRSSYSTKSVSSVLLDGLTLKKGQTNIGLTFDEDCMIKVVWNGHKVYVRYGLNENSGSSQAEMFLVDKNGNIDSSTPIAWDYDKIDSITIYSLQDAPITVEGGTFITKANNQPRAYTYYARNIVVSRPHTTLKNVIHLIEGEGSTGAPYNGFYSANNTYDVTFENLTFTGHKTYKLATDERNSMGTYDTASSYSVKVMWKNCHQSNSITDTTRWGVHASNFCKDLRVTGCSMSRFDAHQGMYNVTVKDSIFGYAFNCIGGGLLYCENVTRLRNDAFVTLRSDYGSTWEGDAVFIDCTFENYNNQACTSRASTGYLFKGSHTKGWDFGYTCYLPQNITVDHFTYRGTGTCYVFWNLSSSSITDSVNPYQICKSVTFRNMQTVLPVSQNTATFASTVITKK